MELGCAGEAVLAWVGEWLDVQAITADGAKHAFGDVSQPPGDAQAATAPTSPAAWDMRLPFTDNHRLFVDSGNFVVYNVAETQQVRREEAAMWESNTAYIGQVLKTQSYSLGSIAADPTSQAVEEAAEPNPNASGESSDQRAAQPTAAPLLVANPSDS